MSPNHGERRMAIPSAAKEDGMGLGIGDRYQKETKYQRGKLGGGDLRRESKPERYKSFPDAPVVALPPPRLEGGLALWEAVKRRRSVRDFDVKALTKEILSQILWATQGITKKFMGYELRAAPSAGALFPVETYVVVQRVEGLEPGIYHYAPQSHSLELLRPGDFREETATAALNQDFLADGAAVFIWTAVFGRSKWKYKERAYRYVYLDAGHIAQNAALAAVALGLGSCQIAALYDDEINALVGADGEEESVVYMTVIGYPKE